MITAAQGSLVSGGVVTEPMSGKIVLDKEITR